MRESTAQSRDEQGAGDMEITSIGRSIVDADEIASISLRAEARRADAERLTWECTPFLLDGQAAELIEIDGRVALAAGADPVWGDALSGEELSVTVRRLIDEGEYA